MSRQYKKDNSLPRERGEAELDVWNSFDTTGHFCPYIPRDDPEFLRKSRETLLTKGHLDTGAHTLMAVSLKQRPIYS